MTTSADQADPHVAEVQGIHGAYIFPEKLLQKIWLRGDFDLGAARTIEGARLEVLFPGRWNSLGGPDFLDARLRFGDGQVVSGDIEVHIHESEWKAHGHAGDPAYSGVILHVVLYPPADARTTLGAAGQRIPIVALLPILHQSLEEFSGDEAVEALSKRPVGAVFDALGQLPDSEVRQLVSVFSRRRWDEKVRLASIRWRRLGWYDACHCAAMEILGFRFNRAPMLRCAMRWPLPEWSAQRADPELVFESEAGRWGLQGCRPANHPRLRLWQYHAWTTLRPEWPAALQSTLDRARGERVCGTETTDTFRRAHQLSALSRQISGEVLGGAVGGTRFENLVCDGFIPLYSAASGRDLHGVWHCWYTGDVPAVVSMGLRRLGFGRTKSARLTCGSVQGLLGWLTEHDRARDQRPLGRSTPIGLS